MKFREKLAVCCGRLTAKIIRLIKHGNGTTFPGTVARWIAPNLLSGLSAIVRENIIAVMGTNGKTTVNNLICRCLEQEGKTVLCNRMGANMESGITAAFILSSEKPAFGIWDYACLEVDEFSAREVLPKLNPGYILVTNLFRDQLDRYGETDIVCQRIIEAIQSVPQATLIINCDDIFSYRIALSCKNPVVFYGINEQGFSCERFEDVQDSLFCPSCGAKLSYDFFHYGHLGVYHCSGCDVSRPTPSCTAGKIRFSETSCSFYLDSIPLRIGTATACHVYNILSAYAVLYAANISVRQFGKTVSSFDFSNHREEVFWINGARIQLFLAKNPVGFQQKLALMGKDLSPKDILFHINDNEPDGRDVSWLWDVNFSRFSGLRAAVVMTAGLRRYDMALRLKYEDIPCQVNRNSKLAIRQLIREGIGNLYIITNYSGLYPLSRFLHHLCLRSSGAKR